MLGRNAGSKIIQFLPNAKVSWNIKLNTLVVLHCNAFTNVIGTIIKVQFLLYNISKKESLTDGLGHVNEEIGGPILQLTFKCRIRYNEDTKNTCAKNIL